MKSSVHIACLVHVLMARTQKLENHRSDHDLIELKYSALLYCLGDQYNSLIYLCSSSLSFKQLLTFITSQPNNQENRALARLSRPSAARLTDF